MKVTTFSTIHIVLNRHSLTSACSAYSHGYIYIYIYIFVYVYLFIHAVSRLDSRIHKDPRTSSHHSILNAARARARSFFCQVKPFRSTTFFLQSSTPELSEKKVVGRVGWSSVLGNTLGWARQSANDVPLRLI